MFRSKCLFHERSHSHAVTLAFTLAFICSSPRPAYAQDSADEARNATPDTTHVGALATINTDTGDFAPGRTSPAHYNSAQLCIAAVQNTVRSVRRDYHTQVSALLAARTPLHDTLPGAAISLAQACVGQFAVATMNREDLPDLVRLALMANRDTVAVNAAAQWVSLTASADAKDTVRSELMEIYLTARPARPAQAAALATRAMAPGVTGERRHAAALARMLQFWSDAFDPAAMHDWAERLLAMVNAMPQNHRYGFRWFVVQAYTALNTVAYIDHPDSMPGIAERAFRDLAQFPADTLSPFSWDPRPATLQDITRLVDPVSGSREAMANRYPPLVAEYWFPKSLAPNDTSPTLLLSTAAEWGGLDGRYSGANCLQGDAEMFPDDAKWCNLLYEEVRQLATKYGHRINIVVVARTRGDALRALPMPPAREADRLRWFFLDYLKLPVTLAVVERPIDQLPMPDGRRWPRPVCNRFPPRMKHAVDTSSVACDYLANPIVFLGRRGALLYRGSFTPLFAAIFARAMNDSKDAKQSSTNE